MNANPEFASFARLVESLRLMAGSGRCCWWLGAPAVQIASPGTTTAIRTTAMAVAYYLSNQLWSTLLPFTS